MDLTIVVLGLTTLFVVVDLGIMVTKSVQRRKPKRHASRTAQPVFRDSGYDSGYMSRG